MKYWLMKNEPEDYSIDDLKNDKTEPIDTSLKHLGSCQSIMFKSIPLPPKMNFNKC